MAKPNKKGPVQTVDIFCSKCKSQLYKYRKGGKGALVKCFKERISIDYTKETCICPNCASVFAREALVRGTPAFKINAAKVYVK
ncbi:hypothetical protein [Psychromonas ossibalaenae]|uniref:hypothetical protein n=1 Tax=Psychromonas ossibalaenae TaxID=444922 RepID=UPI000382A8B3|nr:hypothetical protein [Psychromonas ossibalaenae]